MSGSDKRTGCVAHGTTQHTSNGSLLSSLRTPEELRKIDEANYHGCLTAIFAQSSFQSKGGDDCCPSVREVLDTIERRFGVTNEVLEKLTTIEVCEMLQGNLLSALQHLRPDTIDWFKQRMNYLLQCASSRTRPIDS